MSESEPVEVDFASAFDDWIGGATVATRSVAVYGKPGLYGDYQNLERELVLAEKEAKGESSIGDSSVGVVLEKMETLYKEWMASKSTWTIKAISDEQITSVRSSVTFPDEPPSIPDDADPAVQSTHNKAVEAYDEKHGEAERQSNIKILSLSVAKIEFANGTVADGVTIEQLEKMRSILGHRQMVSLVQAATLATIEEPEITAPKSRSSSKGDQT